jgi:ribonucleoside-triphosphate reductase
MLDRIKLQGLFDKHFSGGSICHINIETTIKNVDYIVDLIKSCAKMGVIYWALNYNLQKCKNSHMSVGKNNVCPICGEEITDNFTRVVGFLTNTKNWHKVRREEDYPNRQFYKV